MRMEAAVLAVLAVLLAWPVPALFARSAWPRRDPVIALICWQALGLAGGLSLIGAPLVYGLGPWGSSLPDAAWALVTGRTPAGVGLDRWVALGLAAVIAGRLVWVLVRSASEVARVQARHRALLAVVARPGAVARTHLVDVADLVAFCLPGGPPMIVLSAGVVAELDAAELAAVVAHERAHLAERHHLFLLAFVAWQRALPMLPATWRASAAVHDLIELRADDVAAARTSRSALARAIARLATGSAAPAGALAATGGVTTVRAARLLEPARPLPLPLRVLALAAAFALLVVPTALLLL